MFNRNRSYNHRYTWSYNWRYNRPIVTPIQITFQSANSNTNSDYIPVCYTNGRSINITIVVVLNRLVGMGLNTAYKVCNSIILSLLNGILPFSQGININTLTKNTHFKHSFGGFDIPCFLFKVYLNDD